MLTLCCSSVSVVDFAYTTLPAILGCMKKKIVKETDKFISPILPQNRSAHCIEHESLSLRTY